MSFVEALSYVARRRWWHFFVASPKQRVDSLEGYPGLLGKLTPEQRAKAFQYDGPLDGGNEKLPKISARRK